MSFPTASVIIAAYNSRETLRNVLHGMLELDYPVFHEVIVVDDGSRDGTAERVRREFGGEEKIKLIAFPENRGVCKARNVGLKAARGEIVVNMDHDCVPESGWLKKVAEPFADETVGVVTGYGGYGGTSTAYRKSALDKVGGYDEAYRYYREDTDLTFRVLEAGYELRFADAPYHHDHAKEEALKPWEVIGYALKRIGHHANDVLLYKKHPSARCKEFLHVVFGFLVDPRWDFATATGLWKTLGHKELDAIKDADGDTGRKLALGSPRGLVFLENRTPLHALLIVLGGMVYVFAVKLVRLAASTRHGKLLV